MWKCSPTRSRWDAAPRRAIASRASTGANPNFESVCPVEIAWWVSPATPGVIRISTSWRRSSVGCYPLQHVELVQRVDHDVADVCGERLAELGRRLSVAVEVDPRGVEPAPEREEQLAARGDVARQPLLGEQPVHRGARKRLRGEQHVEVGVASGHRLHERAGPGADVVLGDDVRRGAELARELDGVAAADLEPTALVDPRSDRIDVGQGGGGRGHRGPIMPCRTRAWHDRRVPRPRTVTPQLPTEIGVHEGLVVLAVAADGATPRAA